jgi:hypothetical protein
MSSTSNRGGRGTGATARATRSSGQQREQGTIVANPATAATSDPAPGSVLPATTETGTSTQQQTGSGEETRPAKKQKLSYMMKDLPMKSLVDTRLVQKVRDCVDKRLYPFDKYYKKQAYYSGPVQMAFWCMGWKKDCVEDAYKRSRGLNAVVEVMAERVSDNREKSKVRCKKKFIGKWLR